MSGVLKAIGVIATLAGLVAAAWITASAADSVTIAVVRDGPGHEEQLIRDIETELHRLVREDIEIRFYTGPQYSADWDGERGAAILRNALAAPDVDIILGVGAMVTLAAAAPDVPLTRPFVSTYAYYADVQGLPLAAGHSSKPGFNAMVLDLDAASEIETFRGLVPFDTLYTGFSNEARMGERIEAYGRSLGIPIVALNISNIKRWTRYRST